MNIELDQMLQRVLPGARTMLTVLPLIREVKLYLIDPAGMNRGFSAGEAKAVFADTPFWAFCWASGYVLASYILEHPEIVRGKRVLDFGSGSGVVAISASMSGAKEAIACDLDPNALRAATINAKLNGVEITACERLSDIGSRCDLLTAADVLYNTNNLTLLDTFIDYASEVLLAESRIKNIGHSSYNRICEVNAATLPDIPDSDSDGKVTIYEARR
jgi:predicted nicotinamide N-methyase